MDRGKIIRIYYSVFWRYFDGLSFLVNSSLRFKNDGDSINWTKLPRAISFGVSISMHVNLVINL